MTMKGSYVTRALAFFGVLILSLFLIVGLPLDVSARGGGGGHGGGSHGGGSHASGFKGSGSHSPKSSGSLGRSHSPSTGGHGGRSHGSDKASGFQSSKRNGSVGRSHFSKGTHSRSQSSLRHVKATHHSRAYVGARDSHGRIERSSAAKDEFMRETGYAHGRPGYVVDHITPLARGGADRPYNMQWQTIAAAKAKDKIELR